MEPDKINGKRLMLSGENIIPWYLDAKRMQDLLQYQFLTTSDSYTYRTSGLRPETAVPAATLLMECHVLPGERDRLGVGKGGMGGMGGGVVVVIFWI